MTQYLMAVYLVEGEPVPPPDEIQESYAAVARFNQKVMDAGAWVFGGGLHPPTTATVVKEQAGDILVTDGPFAEAKEQIGGFWIIEAPDLDAALAWAGEATVACKGAVEVRPFQDEPES